VGVNDRVRVKVEYLMLKKVKVLVELESGVTGGESRHEDVDSTVVRLVFFQILVDDLQTFLVADSDLTNVK